MRKLITAALILILAAVVAPLAWSTDQIIQYNEKMVGANHPTRADTLNRGFLINHSADGTHQDNIIAPGKLQSSSGTAGATTYYRGDGAWGTPSVTPTLPWENLTNVPTTIAGYGITDAMVSDNVAITGGSITGTTITLIDNSIAPEKLQASGVRDNTTVYYGDGRWAAPSLDFQSQLDLKQGLDADLTVLSYLTNWVIIYGNGSHTVTELALGDNATYLRSNGPSAAPTFSAVTAVGNADTATALAANGANCSSGQAPLGVDASGAVEGCWTPTANLNDSTMDNTIIGGTTPVAGTFTTLTSSAVAITGGTIDNVTNIDNTPIGATTPSTGVFTTLDTSSVTNEQFGYLSGVSSDIQTQIDLKRALDNVTFTGAGVASFDNEVQATQFNSTGLDNTHYVNVANSGKPNVGTEALGDCHYDNTTTVWECWDGDSWEPPAFSTISHGANPTIDGEGEAGVDNTADQLVYYGTAERVLTYKMVKNFTIYAYSASLDNVVELELEDAATLTSFSCRTGSTDNVSVTLYECDANAANCSTTGLTAAATSTTATDSSPSNADIDAGDRIVVALTSLAGTPSKVACVLRYTITRQ